MDRWTQYSKDIYKIAKSALAIKTESAWRIKTNPPWGFVNDATLPLASTLGEAPPDPNDANPIRVVLVLKSKTE